MKILYVTTIGATMGFFPEHIKMLESMGHTVELACNTDVSPVPEVLREHKIHNISFSRSPLSKQNLEGYKAIKRLIHREHYDIVHTHTPNASACVRLACKGMKGVKVFYTAHGFHFYKGAPIKNWLLYYSVECLCAYWTDTLITINKEDYRLAKQHMHAKRVCYIPGVGLDLGKFGEQQDKEKIRQKLRDGLSLKPDDVLLLSIGEINENKNHEVVVKALGNLSSNVHYAIGGVGDKTVYLKHLAKELGVSDRFHLLGYLNNVEDWYKAADVFVFPSFREGLSVSLMEAMASGMPCVVSKIRGNTDLIDSKGGTLFDPHDVGSITKTLQNIIMSPYKKAMGNHNVEKIKRFDLQPILSDIKKIYQTSGDKRSKTL